MNRNPILFYFFVTYLYFSGYFVKSLDEKWTSVLTTMVSIVFLFFYFPKIRKLKKSKAEINIILGVVVAMIVLLITDRFYEMAFLYTFILCPAIVILIGRSVFNNKSYIVLSVFFFFFYVINAIISYIEKATFTPLLYTGEVTWDSTEDQVLSEFIFRATGLLGHPLQNSMVMGVLMSVLLLCNIKWKYKFSLWVMGFASLLCFNGRGAIIASVILLLWYLIGVGSMNKFVKIIVISMFVFISYEVTLLISDTPLAGRLVTGDVMEGNGNERLRIWSFLTEMDFIDFFLGVTEEHLKVIRKTLQLYTAENWFVIFVYRMGVPFTLFFIVNYIRVFLLLLKGVERNDKIFVLMSFLILSSLNNSLAVGLLPLTTALLLFLLFGYYERKKNCKLRLDKDCVKYNN